MHIGLNLVFLTPGEQGGMETYARELIPELVAAAPNHTFTSFVNRDAASADGPWTGLTESVVVPVRARDRVEWVRGEQQLLSPLARRMGVELMHSLASTAPVWGPFNRVTTIHDLNYRTVPDAHPGLRSLGMRVLVPLAAHRSTRVIADSQATATDVERHLHVDPRRIDVVPLGIGLRPGAPMPEAQLREGLAAGDRPLLLTVSAKLAHKNLDRLLRALATLPQARRPILILPGYATAHESELRAQADALGIGADVRFLGWISHGELEGLYSAAVGVVMPTLAEGFGLPVLEAMARGAAVACSDIPVLREIAGDGDALWFDPLDVTAIARAITRLIDDPELVRRLGAAGLLRAAQFSWRQTAAATLDSYARASARR